MALVHLEEYASAIEAADQGISFFDQPPATDNPYDVWVNIGESLYRMKALALLRRGDFAAGREVLCEGFRRFPESEYLTQAAEEFLPEF